MFGLGLPELLLIFLIVFILFGANKLPQLGSGLGQAIRNFSDAMKGSKTEKDKTAEGEQKPPKHIG
ncbi:MAG: twin-arginine translocase TatA/TatE family subunit [Nitrospinae bacterium]|nr:twin-arginine translocase TatA/TatE family subunit [Nitrospinota bacterium]